jgi:hypothetical protein
VWTGFNWVRIGYSGGFLYKQTVSNEGVSMQFIGWLNDHQLSRRTQFNGVIYQLTLKTDYEFVSLEQV